MEYSFKLEIYSGSIKKKIVNICVKKIMTWSSRIRDKKQRKLIYFTTKQRKFKEHYKMKGEERRAIRTYLTFRTIQQGSSGKSSTKHTNTTSVQTMFLYGQWLFSISTKPLNTRSFINKIAELKPRGVDKCGSETIRREENNNNRG